MRASLAPDGEIKAAFTKMSQAVSQDRRGLRDQTTRVKLASAIGDLDTLAGFDKLYDRKLPDPVATVFNSSVKIAANMMDLGGRLADSAKVASLPASFFSDALGADVLSEIAPGGRVDARVSDMTAAIKHNAPYDKESYYYRTVFAQCFPGKGRAETIPYFWRHPFCEGVLDPSARLLKDVYSSENHGEPRFSAPLLIRTSPNPHLS